ncbi:hypothetical protein AD940_01415 [Gluconobacter thailandicus]|uniref:hypothetical protein n=1 Tax=Gluconobacter thailandicus TaxID=257438 RepID=UPI000776F511|nr:hypothetical protein [Gluconobacter thailandicus]KXV35828.1 hypothetical protein AD940_01415 [Gluconobacter thailandicus]
MKTCLVICEGKDSHAETIKHALLPAGFETHKIEIPSDNIPDFYINFSLQESTISFGEKTINLSQIDIVFYLVKYLTLSEINNSSDPYDFFFKRNEWIQAIEFLQFSTKNALWIDCPLSQKKASNKLLQLKIAQDSGMRIPNTVLTNNISHLLDLFECSEAGIIYKSLYSPFYDAEKIIYAAKVSKEQIIDNKKEIRLTPNLFQEYVDKSYEIRVVWLLGEAIAIKIDSQNNEKSSVDWRKFSFNPNMYSFHVLNPILLDKINKFMLSIGLNFGVLDLIIKPDGDEVFLEVNPSGRWDFLDHFCEQKISKMLARSISNFYSYS